MDLFEYQARELFAKHGVPVLKGIVATTPEEAKAAAEEIGGLTVIKAQVKTGGRGKAGGVKLAKSPEEAYEHAKAILGMDIKGHTVHRVLVADGADIAEEYYFSLLLDRANRSYLAMCSVEGGMEIEQLAAERPEALDAGCFVLAGIDAEPLLQAVEMAVGMQRAECFGTPVADYTAENVSMKVARIIQSYTGIVNKMVWRKDG